MALAKAARALLGAAVLASVGCCTVLGIDSNRYLDTDAGPDWTCLTQPSERIDPNLRVDLTLVVMDATKHSSSAGAVDGGSDLDTVSGTWLPNVSVSVCALLDPTCANGVGPEVTDDAGLARFTLSGDFTGYFAFSRPDLVPATLYPGNLLAGDTVASFPAFDLAPKEMQDLAASTNSTAILDPDAGVGHALVTVYDCQDHQATGVALAYSYMGSKTVPFYFDHGLPSTSATATDGYGLGGAINVPVGTLTVTAMVAATMTPLGSTTFDIRAGGLTAAWIRVRTH